MKKKRQSWLIILFTSAIIHCSVGLGYKNSIDFDSAMSLSPEYQKSTDIKWDIFKNLYFVNVQNACWYEQSLIPKRIHHIWLGSPFPEEYKQLRQTWIDNHPGWEFYLWTDENVKQLKIYNYEAFQKVKNYGVKSDILRYEILYTYGGLYVDTDFECLKPFDVFHHTLSFYSGINYDGEPGVFNGLIACEPQSPIIKKCIFSLRSDVASFRLERDIFKVTGPQYLTECFFNSYFLCNKPVALLPVIYFYPWPHFVKNPKNYREFINQESYAIHHWHASWVNK